MKMNLNNKNGYTLLELMMYMLIAVMVIGFAFHMISRTQKQYGQQRSMSKLQGEGRNTIYIVAADIQNCGFKNYLLESPANIYSLTRIAEVTTGEDKNITPASNRETGNDSASSFYILNSTTDAYDTLEIFKGSINTDGTFNQVERVTYKVVNENLLRLSQVFNDASNTWVGPTTSTSGDRDTVIITENVESLQFEFSTDKTNWVVDPTGFKNSIKAIRVAILIRTNRTVPQQSVANTYYVGGDTVSVSGNFLRRLYTETVEVVNNGL